MVRDPAAWGVAPGYVDLAGQWHEPDAEVVDRLLTAMGAPLDGAGPPEPAPMWFVRSGTGGRVLGPATVVLEDGTDLGAVAELPLDLPVGYHDVHPDDGGPSTRLVVTPGVCPQPPGRLWGPAIQLYATRSRASWGIGDFGDLRSVIRWATDAGAGVVALNPLHAHGPGHPQQASPYFPSSRRFLDPLYLRVEEVDGASAPALLETVARGAAAGRVLVERRTIDRDEVWRIKRAVLERCFSEASLDPVGYRVFSRWRAEEGAALESFATFCAIADRHGDDWRHWPAALRHPAADAVAEFVTRNPGLVAFHAWLQHQLDRQLAAASHSAPLLADLAVGFDPGGADAWAWQDLIAVDARIGAPPDEFNVAGQDWGLPPFVPHQLRAARYEPFISTLREVLAHAGGLRVDHVMGLFRLWWVAPGASSPATGGYVQYPAGDLLDILAVEAHRAGAFVVGEDLGLVQDEVRDELGRRGVLSTRLAWFEDAAPESWPAQSVGSLGTHDLATVAGVWTGSDVANRKALDLPLDDESEGRVGERLRRLTGLSDDATVDEVSAAAHRRLADAGSSVVLASLADILGLVQRVNVPGTTTQWPNWSVALPVEVDDLPEHTVAGHVTAAMATRQGHAGQ